MTHFSRTSPGIGGFPKEEFHELEQVEQGHWWFESRNRLILNTIKKYFSPVSEFLEIGCGSGFSLKAINEAHPKAKIVGTELFEEGLEIARKRMPKSS